MLDRLRGERSGDPLLAAGRFPEHDATVDTDGGGVTWAGLKLQRTRGAWLPSISTRVTVGWPPSPAMTHHPQLRH